MMPLYYIDNPLSDNGRNLMNEMFSELFKEYSDAGLNAEEAREKAVQAVADSLLAKEDASVAKEMVQQIIDGSIDTGALDTNIEQRLNDLEVQYAPTLNSVKSELAQRPTKNYVDGKMQGVSLAYKESYATLADLETAYPSGDAFNHVVLSNGMIYTWSNGVWTNTEIQGNGTGLADNSVTQRKTTFINVSKNLFDKSTASQPGYYVSWTDGLIKEGSTGYLHSDWIKVEPNQTYTINHHSQLAFYDINKTYLGGRGNTYPSPFTMTMNYNAEWVRVTLTVSDLDRYQMEEGSVVTPYEDGSYDKLYSRIKINSNNLEEPLVNEFKHIQQIFSRIVTVATKVKLIGDSITAGVGGTGYATDGELIYTDVNGSYYVNTSGYCWANELRDYLQEKFNCTIKNYGCSGISSGNILNNFDSLVEADDDIIICQIGTNNRIDYGNNSTETLREDLIEIGNRVRTMGKEIIFMSAPPASVSNEVDTVRRFHMEDVDNVIMSVAAEFKMEYISNYKNFLNYCELKGITIDSLLTDGLHPNDTGYDVMFNFICGRLGIGRKRDDATW